MPMTTHRYNRTTGPVSCDYSTTEAPGNDDDDFEDVGASVNSNDVVFEPNPRRFGLESS